MKQQTKRLLKSLCMAVGVVLLSAVDPLAGYAAERTIDIKHLGEGQSIVRVDAQAKYLLLPVEESSPESKLYMIVDNDVVRTFNVRLAVITCQGTYGRFLDFDGRKTSFYLVADEKGHFVALQAIL